MPPACPAEFHVCCYKGLPRRKTGEPTGLYPMGGWPKPQQTAVDFGLGTPPLPCWIFASPDRLVAVPM
jgi:hypothetical protein